MLQPLLIPQNKESIINCIDDKEMANKAKPDSEAEHETKDMKERRPPFYHQLGNSSFFFFYKCKKKVKQLVTIWMHKIIIHLLSLNWSQLMFVFSDGKNHNSSMQTLRHVKEQLRGTLSWQKFWKEKFASM